MPGAHEFLKDLAVVLCVAALTTVLFARLRQPVVLGYLLAGLIIGPHVPVPVVADLATVTTLSELGVVLLMFSLGLEFRLRRLVELAPVVVLIVIVEVSLMLWVGFLAGRLLGWSAATSLFAGAAVAISSTTIIAKAFEEHDAPGRLREIVFGILVFEDLAAVMLVAALTPVAAGGSLSPGAIGLSAARLVAFLVALLVGGMLFVPRLVSAIVRHGRPETVLLASVGLCFALALLSETLGYPAALGAFLAGALAAESGEHRRLAVLVRPVRDMFAAIFFVAVGMSIDPRALVANAAAVALLVLVVLIGKPLGVGLGTFFAGHGIRNAVQAGLSLAQIGEFSFIIAGVGVQLGGDATTLYAAVVAVSAVTTLTTPHLVRAAGQAAGKLDDALPAPLQTFAALYASWVEQLRAASAQGTVGARIRRLVGFLLLDAALLAAIVVAASLVARPAAALVEERLAIGETAARALVAAGAIGLGAPFCLGIIQLARRLGRALADLALPASAGLDLAAAPRRALVVTLELACVLLVGGPIVAITQPFLPTFHGAAVLLVLLAVLGVAFWRSATNLEGHVRAGAHMIAEALAKQARHPTMEHALDEVSKILPGLGTPVPLRLPPGSPAVGKTLAELNLRGATGATVLAITRGVEGLVVPTAGEVLREGDVLALAGAHEAIGAAAALLGAKR